MKKRNIIIYVLLLVIILMVIMVNPILNKENTINQNEMYDKSKTLIEKKAYAFALATLDELNENDFIPEILYLKGFCCFKLRFLEKTIYNYERYIKYDSLNYESYFFIGMSYKFLLKDSIAINYFEKALLINPSDSITKEELIESKQYLKNKPKL